MRDCAAEALPAAEIAEAEQGPRSVFCEGVATPDAKAGHRNRAAAGGGEGKKPKKKSARSRAPFPFVYFLLNTLLKLFHVEHYFPRISIAPAKSSAPLLPPGQGPAFW